MKDRHGINYTDPLVVCSDYPQIETFPQHMSYSGGRVYTKTENLRKMPYDPNKAKAATIPKPGTQDKEATIIKIEDGKTRDFLPKKAIEKWESGLDDPCIHVTCLGKHDGQEVIVKQRFTYKNDEKGDTIVGRKSLLAKFIKVYEYPPEEGKKVILDFDGDYWNLYLGSK